MERSPFAHRRAAATWWWIVPLAVVALALHGERAARPEGRVLAPRPADRRLDLAVVGVRARIGRDTVQSTGVVIDAARGLVLTTAHSLWGATSLKLVTGLAVLHGRIVARSACADLALVETQPRLPGLVGVSGSAGSPRAGARTVVLRRRGLAPGAPGAVAAVRVRLGAPAAVASIDSRLPGLGQVLRVDGPLRPRDTGAPALDGRGRLIGVVRAAREGASPAAVVVRWRSVRAHLDELRPGRGTVYVGWRRQYRCAPVLHAYEAATHPGFRRADARLNAPIPATRLHGTQGLDR
jgi:S1-C subfamily serine protease